MICASAAANSRRGPHLPRRVRITIAAVALSSTVFVFEIDLADSDRGVYETLSLRVARHPSESDEYLVARVLAYCLEYTEGIEFSRGLSDADEPPLAVRDLTGRMTTWIDVGTPSADRLHRASKAVARVVVYVHKGAEQWLESLRAGRIHEVDRLEIRQLDRALISGLVAVLGRRMSMAISIAGGEAYVAMDAASVSGPIVPLTVGV
jgi:uncharacterized protein YaeQ